MGGFDPPHVLTRLIAFAVVLRHGSRTLLTLVTAHTPPFVPPTGYSRIKVVSSFDELVSTRFSGGVNALCWPRALPGDFGEVVEGLGVGKGITSVEASRLQNLALTAEGKVARDILVQDQALLRSHDLSPSLDCIRGYLDELDDGPVPTHVQSFHVDSATVEADTYLCTYHGPASEGLRNDESRRRVDLPEIRAELLKLHGGADDDTFLEYLSERFFDLHYAPLPQARPFSFGRHHLWRIATEYPDSPVPPCIHRAPATLPGQPPRLLLIS